MTSIATTLSGVISIIQVGQEIYRMIAEYMDEMDQIKQSGADKKPVSWLMLVLLF